jgi:hypothetical protein
MAMKKLKSALLSVTLFWCMTSCISNPLPDCSTYCPDCDERIKNLEDRRNEIFLIVHMLIEAGAGGDYQITHIDTIETPPGYIIHFLKGDSITIYNTDPASLIGIREYEGVYYWTLNGDWLMDDKNENKIPVTGIAPQVRINPETGYWEISVNGGRDWTSTGVLAQGPGGNTFFQDNGIDDTNPRYIIIRFVCDGVERQIRIPRYVEPIKITDGIDLTSSLKPPVSDDTPMSSFTDNRLTGLVTWMRKNSDGSFTLPVALNEKFRSNTEYQAQTTLRPLAGYAFPDTAIISVRHDQANSPQTVNFQIEELKNDKDEIVDRVAKGKITFTTTKSYDENFPVDDRNLTEKIPQPQEGKEAIVEFGAYQYTGTVRWDGALPNGKFQVGTAYKAIVTLTPRTTYTFNGMTNDFIHTNAETVSTVFTNNGQTATVTIVFPKTLQDKPVNELDLSMRIPKPVMWETPVRAANNAQYAFSVVWHDRRNIELKPGGTFEANQYYAATVSLTAEDGYTFKYPDTGLPVIFTHGGGTLTTTPPGATWDGKTLQLRIAFPVTGTSLPSWFSGKKGIDDSAIDLIGLTAAAGQNTLFITIGAPDPREPVTLTDDTDLGATGLVLTAASSPTTLTIDGTGLTVDLTGAAKNVPLITVGSGVDLVLQNIAFKGLSTADAVNADAVNNNAPVILVKSGGKLTLGSGAMITDNYGNCGVRVDPGGELIMLNGAEVSHSENGVSVYGTFTMDGGRIHHNTTTRSNGGGVLVDNDGGYFLMNGGDIYENTATFGGGVAVINGATLTISSRGGSIRDNRTTAGGGGGGVYVCDPGSKFYMEGGVIRGNHATASGSGGFGGGVFLNGDAEIFTMNFSATISDNVAARGGGVYTDMVAIELKRGAISSNTATTAGGGVYVANAGSLIMMADGTGFIRGNEVTNKDGMGGGVYVASGGSVTMYSGLISSNSIYRGGPQPGGLGKGAGVYVENNGRFAKHSGGGVINGALGRSGVGGEVWDNTLLQNCYRWPIDNEQGTAQHYAPPGDYGHANVPGGNKTGYAVYFEYRKDGKGPYRRNQLLTESEFLYTDQMEEGWDATDPF